MATISTITYMPIDIGFAKKRGFTRDDIVYHRIGNKNVACLKVECDPEFKKTWETMQDTEMRATLREKRCLIPDGKGGFIRCPAQNSCKNCEKRLEFGFTTNKPLSWEKLTKPEDEEDEVIDIQGENETGSDINARLVFEEVNEYLKTLDNKSYAHVFTMVYERYTTKEIADKLNIPWSTAKDLIERVQGIAFDYYNQGRGGRK